MIYCPQCGTSLPDGSAFCESCGTAIPQPTAYEAPAYEYAAPAYQPAVRTPAAPVWIVALAMLIGMVLNRFLVRYAFLFSGFPNGPTGSFNGNLWTATYYIVIIACSLIGIAIYNAVCRSWKQPHLALSLSDFFIPFGCYILTTFLITYYEYYVMALGKIRMGRTMYEICWLFLALIAAAITFFVLLASVKSRQKILYSQQAYDPYAQTQW